MQSNEDVRFLIATVHCLLAPVLPTLCGDLHLEMVLWTSGGLSDYDCSDTPSGREFDGRSLIDSRALHYHSKSHNCLELWIGMNNLNSSFMVAAILVTTVDSAAYQNCLQMKL